jgi:hypothetical protein
MRRVLRLVVMLVVAVGITYAVWLVAFLLFFEPT